MEEIEVKPQINTLTDKANYTLALGGMLGAAVASTWLLNSPLITAFIVTHSINEAFFKYRMSKTISEINSPTPADQIPDEFKQVPERIEALSRKMGLDAVPYFYVDEGSVDVSAQAGSIGKTNITFKNMVGSGLDADEIDAIVVHELTHIADKHSQKQMRIETLKDISIKNSKVYFFGAFVNQVLTSPSQASASLVAYAAESAQHASAHLSSIMTAVAGNPFSHAIGPEKALAAVVALAIGLQIVDKQFAKACEYQSDRVSGEVTGKPAALDSALKKQRAKMEKALGVYGKRQDKSALQRSFLKVGRLLAFDHPAPEKRSKALKKIEKRLSAQKTKPRSSPRP